MPDELSRLEWYKRASANLRKYLAELEAALASRSPGYTQATGRLVTEVKRRLVRLQQEIAEADTDAQQQ